MKKDQLIRKNCGYLLCANNKSGVKLAPFCAKYVLNTCCLVRFLNLWCGFGTDLNRLCAEAVPNSFYLVQFLNLLWVWHRLCLSMCQVCAKYFLLDIINTLGVTLGQIYHFVVPNLRQAVTDWHNVCNWPRYGTSLGQICFYKIIMFG